MDSTPKVGPPAAARLGLWDTASIIVGIIIGVGIFKTPSDVFSQANGPWQALAIWVLGGVISLLGAFCFAELASTYPRSGGEYVYLTRAYGRWAGFLFAWAQLAVIRTGGSIAAMAYIFADYAGKLLQAGRPEAIDGDYRFLQVGLALLVIVVLTVINLLGVHFGKATQNFLTVLKVLGLTGVLVTGLWCAQSWQVGADHPVYQGREVTVVSGRVAGVDPYGGLRLRDDVGQERTVAVDPAAKITLDDAEKKTQGANYQLADLPAGAAVKVIVPAAGGAALRVNATNTSAFGALALALIMVLWTYAGWHEAAYVAAEVQNRRRNLPLALIVGTGAVLVLYLLVNVAYLVGLGYEGAADSRMVAADVLKLLPWRYGEQAMCLLVMLSALGAINGMIFTSSRIFTEMGADHRLFTKLGKWDPRWGTPVRSLLAQAAITVAMVAVVGIWFQGNGFEVLVYCTAPVFWLFFLLTGLALIVLRFKDRGIERPFTTPAYPLPALVFCFFCGFMVYGSVAYKPIESLVGLVILAVGVPLYLFSRRPARRQEEVVPPEVVSADLSFRAALAKR
jgi:amino acid transporter